MNSLWEKELNSIPKGSVQLSKLQYVLKYINSPPIISIIRTMIFFLTTQPWHQNMPCLCRKTEVSQKTKGDERWRVIISCMYNDQCARVQKLRFYRWSTTLTHPKFQVIQLQMDTTTSEEKYLCIVSQVSKKCLQIKFSCAHKMDGNTQLYSLLFLSWWSIYWQRKFVKLWLNQQKENELTEWVSRRLQQHRCAEVSGV